MPSSFCQSVQLYRIRFVNIAVIMANFAILFTFLSIILTTAAIRCIRYNNDTTYDEDCNYCGFGNITKNTGNTINEQIHHQCLPYPEFSAGGYSTDHVNVCYETSDFKVQLYLCDYDLCNTGCKGTPVISNGATAKPVVNGDVTTAKHGDASNTGIGFCLILCTILYHINLTY